MIFPDRASLDKIRNHCPEKFGFEDAFAQRGNIIPQRGQGGSYQGGRGQGGRLAAHPSGIRRGAADGMDPVHSGK